MTDPHAFPTTAVETMLTHAAEVAAMTQEQAQAQAQERQQYLSGVMAGLAQVHYERPRGLIGSTETELIATLAADYLETPVTYHREGDTSLMVHMISDSEDGSDEFRDIRLNGFFTDGKTNSELHRFYKIGQKGDVYRAEEASTLGTKASETWILLDESDPGHGPMLDEAADMLKAVIKNAYDAVRSQAFQHEHFDSVAAQRDLEVMAAELGDVEEYLNLEQLLKGFIGISELSVTDPRTAIHVKGQRKQLVERICEYGINPNDLGTIKDMSTSMTEPAIAYLTAKQKVESLPDQARIMYLAAERVNQLQ